MRKVSLWLGAVLAFVPVSALHADEADDVAAKFGARQSVRQAALSPDGNSAVLVTSRPDGGENAAVLTFAGVKTVPLIGSKAGEDRIFYCQFASAAQVVCSMYMIEGSGNDASSAQRLVAVGADGSKPRVISARTRSGAYFHSGYGGQLIDYNAAGKPGSVLITRYNSVEGQTGNLLGRSERGFLVEAVDLASNKRVSVVPARETAVEYTADGIGNVRIMGLQPVAPSGYARREVNYQYRSAEGGAWQPLSTVTFDGGLSTGFNPVAVDPASNSAFGFDNHQGRKALFARTLDGSGATRLLLARPDVDVDGLLRIGRNQRVIGASYASEYRIAEYFDPELKRLATALARAFPGNPSINFVDSSEDEKKLLLLISSDTDPGSYYLYDKTTRQLGSLLPLRPELAGLSMGTMKPVRYPAADGTQIPGYLTLPPGSDGKGLPAIVMPHGGPGARDEWGFDWLVQYFVARGYAVLQPNYRGSAGYGSQWFQKNGFQSWQVAIGDVNDAGKWLVSQGIAAPGKLAILGWSYGGYAALQSQVVDADLYKAVVAVAPVTDLDALLEENRNQSNFYNTQNFIGTGPHVAAGSPARHAAAFKAPVLMFHGDKDLNVGVGQARLMRGRLAAAGKPVTYVEFPGLDHQLDNAPARQRLLADSDRFIRRALGL